MTAFLHHLKQFVLLLGRLVPLLGLLGLAVFCIPGGTGLLDSGALTGSSRFSRAFSATCASHYLRTVLEETC